MQSTGSITLVRLGALRDVNRLSIIFESSWDQWAARLPRERQADVNVLVRIGTLANVMALELAKNSGRRACKFSDRAPSLRVTWSHSGP